MKKSILLTAGLLLLFGYSMNGSDRNQKKNTSKDASAVIFCSKDISGLSATWIREFDNDNPDMKVTLKNFDEGDLIKEFTANGNLCLVSENYLSNNEYKALWMVIVGRDVVVPIINKSNPLLKKIGGQGVSASSLSGIFEADENMNWGYLMGTGNDYPLHYYSTADKNINGMVNNFLGRDISRSDMILCENDKDLVAMVRKDPFALGFCKLTNITDEKNQSLVSGIKLLPIDKNANGTIDYFEAIYGDVNDFIRGTGIGKYPQSLISSIYAVSNENPQNNTERAFVKWVLGNGQNYLMANGLLDLTAGQKQYGLDKLASIEPVPIPTVTSYSGIKTAIVIFLVVLLLGILVEGIYFSVKYNRSLTDEEQVGVARVFDEESVNVLGGLFYDKTHTWAFMEPDGCVKIGIDDFLQHVTGPLTRVKMKEPGHKVKKGDEILSVVQNGKQLTIYSPISGVIRAQNKKLSLDSSLLNSSPFSEGWVYRIEPLNWLREIQFLFMEKNYKEWIKTEFSRFKDFLADSVNAHNLQVSYRVLQDGGEIKEGILSDMGPEAWEDFQTSFIDTSH